MTPSQQITMTTKPTNKQLIHRALWLAFQASAPMGLGFFHAGQAKQITEETLPEHVMEAITRADGTIIIGTDYVSGRMMKTDFEVTPSGELKIRPEVPRHDYNSWAGQYPTAKALIEATEKSFA